MILNISSTTFNFQLYHLKELLDTLFASFNSQNKVHVRYYSHFIEKENKVQRFLLVNCQSENLSRGLQSSRLCY